MDIEGGAGSSLERFVVVSGERVPTSLLVPLGVAAWVFVCSFALNRESEYKLHCPVLLKIPRSMGEILTIPQKKSQPHRFLVPQNFETG